MLPVFVALKVGTVPEMGFPVESSIKIEIKEVEVPSGSIGPVPVKVECKALAGP